MAKRLKWATSAKIQRQEILDYWIKSNQSKIYSQKLNKLFHQIQFRNS